jgi:hypothetical protein
LAVAVKALGFDADYPVGAERARLALFLKFGANIFVRAVQDALRGVANTIANGNTINLIYLSTAHVIPSQVRPS